jgi:acyl carrier protein
LKLPPTGALKDDQPLRDLGFDSLMVVRVTRALSEELGEALPTSFLFDYPTIESLVQGLVSRASPQTQPTTDKLSARLTILANTPESDAEAELDRQLAIAEQDAQ